MKKGIIIFISVIILGMIILGLVLCNNGAIIYSNTFYSPMGSEQIRIYENGLVEIDLEIENPDHKRNFEKIKILNDKELETLIDMISKDMEEEEIKKGINLLIHDDANYNLGLPN